MKTLSSLFLLVLAAIPVMAADAPKQPAPPPGVTLTGQEWQMIAVSLQRSDVISARQAIDLINKINAQLQPPQAQAGQLAKSPSK